MSMDFLNSLFQSGSKGPANMASMGMPTVPQDASQLRVPQMPLDITSIPATTGANVAVGVPQTMAAPSANPMSGLLEAMVSGGVGALGGKDKQEAPQAQQFRGGSQFSNPGAAAISGLRFSGGNNTRGIMNG
jgi:hypothetical protein